ncbi:hypothetical protein D9M70_651280 [compost metagenome]
MGQSLKRGRVTPFGAEVFEVPFPASVYGDLIDLRRLPHVHGRSFGDYASYKRHNVENENGPEVLCPQEIQFSTRQKSDETEKPDSSENRWQ